MARRQVDSSGSSIVLVSKTETRDASIYVTFQRLTIWFYAVAVFLSVSLSVAESEDSAVSVRDGRAGLRSVLGRAMEAVAVLSINPPELVDVLENASVDVELSESHFSIFSGSSIMLA
jgi:hypothetical protein